jgi:hypothetical protein
LFLCIFFLTAAAFGTGWIFGRTAGLQELKIVKAKLADQIRIQQAKPREP